MRLIVCGLIGRSGAFVLVSGIERKVRNPTVTILERLAKALKVAPGRLLD